MTTACVWSLRYIDDLVLRERNNERLYSLADANWNVVCVTDDTGAAQERYVYDAFGRVEGLTSDWNRTFTGQVFDAETGLMLYRNRHYSPGLGRFLTRDPIGYRANDVNLTRYVRDGAISYTDGQGLWAIPIGAGIVGCLAAGGASIFWDYWNDRKTNWCKAVVSCAITGAFTAIAAIVPTASGCLAGAAGSFGSSLASSFCDGSGYGACEAGADIISTLLGCLAGMAGGHLSDKLPGSLSSYAEDVINAVSSALGAVGGAFAGGGGATFCNWTPKRLPSRELPCIEI